MLDAIHETFCAGLGKHKRVKVKEERASGEEVGTAASKLASATTRQDESQILPGIDQKLNFVQQARKFLDLVDHHERVFGCGPLTKKFRPRAEFSKRIGLQKVHITSGRVVFLQEGAFSRLSRP